jgi:conjugative transfer signal peptidase TraF
MTHLDANASLGGLPPADTGASAADLCVHAVKDQSASYPWWVIASAATVIILGRTLYGLFGPPLVINTTASEPRGVYWLQEREHHVRGELVAFSTPPAFRALIATRGWAPDGVPLLKSIAALEGDLVCTNDGEISINGKPVGPIVSADSAGRPLPKIRGCYSVPAGEFLPLSTLIPNSFDGRYMGPQSLSLIRGEARRLWTF